MPERKTVTQIKLRNKTNHFLFGITCTDESHTAIPTAYIKQANMFSFDFMFTLTFNSHAFKKKKKKMYNAKLKSVSIRSLITHNDCSQK